MSTTRKFLIGEQFEINAIKTSNYFDIKFKIIYPTDKTRKKEINELSATFNQNNRLLLDVFSDTTETINTHIIDILVEIIIETLYDIDSSEAKIRERYLVELFFDSEKTKIVHTSSSLQEITFYEDCEQVDYFSDTIYEIIKENRHTEDEAHNFILEHKDEIMKLYKEICN